MPDVSTLIELVDVSIQRGPTRILDHIRMRIPRDEHVAIVGPNGSGKSTLLKVLMKFFYPSVIDGHSGIVRVLGQEEWNVWELRKQLGFISSEIDHHFTLGRSARLTALQSVLTGFTSSELEPLEGAITSEMTADAKRWLEQFHMDAKSKKCIGHMSTGERRRVLLARAMVLKPKAIILDEPTAGLDLYARWQLLRELNEFAAAGIQIVLVTHHLEEIMPCMQRTILLKEGRVAFDGCTSDALTAEHISDLFNIPIQVERNVQGFYRSHLA